MGPLKIIKGDKVLLRYQILEGGAPRDITGMDFRLEIRKEKEAEPFDTVKGFIEDGESGRFSFTITETAEPFSGTFEIFMFTRTRARTTLTPPGGFSIEVLETEEALI